MGAVIGAVVGFALGGPEGAVAGALLGAAVGNDIGTRLEAISRNSATLPSVPAFNTPRAPNLPIVGSSAGLQLGPTVPFATFSAGYLRSGYQGSVPNIAGPEDIAFRMLDVANILFMAYGIGEIGLSLRTLGEAGLLTMRKATSRVALERATEVAEVAVYEGINAEGKVVYVGITRDVARRALEHETRFQLRVIEGLSNLPRSTARGVEQALIEIYGLEKNGGRLINAINSIAKTNSNYEPLVEAGKALLKTINYGAQ